MPLINLYDDFIAFGEVGKLMLGLVLFCLENFSNCLRHLY